MKKKDMALLIEAEDTLDDMDRLLEQFTGYGHSEGDFIKLDNIFEVIHNNSHKYYTENSEEKMQLFLSILMCRDKMLSVKLDAPVLCRLDAPELDFACCASADCLHQHLQVI